jgi:hypothetical protein
MTGLAALQLALQRDLLEGSDHVAGEVATRSGLDTPRRLAIYRNAYRMRLVDTLSDSFGHTLAYLGDENFRAAALAYVESHPSTQPNLRWYGAEFPAWLAQAHPEDLHVAELAGLDWTLRRAFDGPDAAAMTLADLAALGAGDWEGLRLALVPTAERIALQHNTLAIWHALDRDEAPPPAQRLPEPLPVLVWRRELSPHFRSLGAAEAAAIDALLEGASFGDVCAAHALCHPDADVAAETGAWLRRWIDEGLLQRGNWR